MAKNEWPEWLRLTVVGLGAIAAGVAAGYVIKPFVDDMFNPKPQQTVNPQKAIILQSDNPGHAPVSPRQQQNSSFHSFVEAGKNPYFRTVELLRPRFTYDKGACESTPIKGRLKGKYQQ